MGINITTDTRYALKHNFYEDFFNEEGQLGSINDFNDMDEDNIQLFNTKSEAENVLVKLKELTEGEFESKDFRIVLLVSQLMMHEVE